MKLLIAGTGALAEQAGALARASALAEDYEMWNGVGAAPTADAALPLTGEGSVLAALAGQRLLFDQSAWALASSRLASDTFLAERGFPVPPAFPEGSEPYIVKPDRDGGGRGIWVTEDFCEVGGAVNAGFVAQEELEGPVWSVAVTGGPGAYTVHPPALLTFLGRTRTAAVCQPAPAEEELRALAAGIGEAMAVRGILEVEAIRSRDGWYVTDLNARLPRLTPAAVLEAAGVNLLDEIIRAFS